MASLLKMKSSLVVKMKNGPVGVYFSLLNAIPLLPATSSTSPSTRSLNTMTPDSSSQFPNFPDLVNGPKNGLSKMMEDINETLDYMKAEIEKGADAYKGWEYSKQDEAAIYFKFYMPGFEKEHLNFEGVDDGVGFFANGVLRDSYEVEEEGVGGNKGIGVEIANEVVDEESEVGESDEEEAEESDEEDDDAMSFCDVGFVVEQVDGDEEWCMVEEM